MELDEDEGLRLDMANYGNISRYANNSCKNLNAMMYKKHVFAEQCNGILYYEIRCFLEAKKSIKKDAEVTITYGDKNNGSLCFCDTCKPPVDPVQLQWDKNAKDD